MFGLVKGDSEWIIRYDIALYQLCRSLDIITEIKVARLRQAE